MILYANGCSYTSGCELEGPNVGDSQYNKDRAWPSILAKKLGAKVINESKAGGSNDRIVRTTLDWILNNSSTEELLVVIGWTDPYRSEIKIDGKYIHLCSAFLQDKKNKVLKEAHRHFTAFYCDDSYAQPKKVHQIILMQDFLKFHRIKYFFFNSILPIYTKYSKNPSIRQNIDVKYYLDPFDIKRSMMNRVFRIFKPVEWGTHPEEAGHKYWGNILYSEIKKRRIIK